MLLGCYKDRNAIGRRSLKRKIMKTEQCSTCRFWRHDLAGSKVAGECRKNAPRLVVPIGEVFASTDDIDWCGEWKEKK